MSPSRTTWACRHGDYSKQVECAQLPLGPLLRRFGHFMRIVGHMLEDLGHLAEVMGEEIDYNSRQEGEPEEPRQEGENEEVSQMQAPGRPTKFVAPGAARDSVPESTALPENTPPPDEEPDQEHGDEPRALTSSSVATGEVLPVLASTTPTTSQLGETMDGETEGQSPSVFP